VFLLFKIATSSCSSENPSCARTSTTYIRVAIHYVMEPSSVQLREPLVRFAQRRIKKRNTSGRTDPAEVVDIRTVSLIVVMSRSELLIVAV
jgi:hypothetical protein